MSIVKSSKGKDKLLLEGFSYRRANKSQRILRFSKSYCAGRVIFDKDEYKLVTEHIHPPDPDENISAEFKATISTNAAVSHDPPRRIIQEALLNVDQNDDTAVPTYYFSQRTIER
jgi:hypothetical protein